MDIIERNLLTCQPERKVIVQSKRATWSGVPHARLRNGSWCRKVF